MNEKHAPSIALTISLCALCAGLGVVVGLAINAGRLGSSIELTFDKKGAVTDLKYKVSDNPFSGQQTQWTTRWYESGEVCRQVEFRGRQPTGRDRVWNPDGTLQFEASPDAAGRLIRRSFNANGSLAARGTQTDQPGRVRWEIFDRAGRPSLECDFVDGKPDGNLIAYYPSGAVAACGSLQAGKRIGEWEFFDEAGGRTTEAELPDGLKRSIPGRASIDQEQGP